jgi:hypothetical protein
MNPLSIGTDPAILRSTRRFLGAIAVTLSCAALTGCVITSGRTVRETGPQISESSLKAIEYNKTTVDWLIAAFGQPANRACTPDGAEILRYDSDIRTTQGSYFFMLAASSENRIERTCWWFETRDGKIVRAWGEECDPCTVDSLNPPLPNGPAPSGPMQTATGQTATGQTQTEQNGAAVAGSVQAAQGSPAQQPTSALPTSTTGNR